MDNRIFDSRQCYDSKFLKIVKEAKNELIGEGALKENIIAEGVYSWNSGPTYETFSETYLGYCMGISAFGMSTVPELMTAHAIGMQNVNISMITNLASFLSETPLGHAEVKIAAEECVPKMKLLIIRILDKLQYEESRKQELIQKFKLEPCENDFPLVPVFLKNELNHILLA
jgi:purine nucleoside phosphorylase